MDNKCPDCGRRKAQNADDAKEGCCDKWYAVNDPEAKTECLSIKHKNRHQQLHSSLDELFADFIEHGEGRTTSTILDLIDWSYTQTQNPDHSSLN